MMNSFEFQYPNLDAALHQIQIIAHLWQTRPNFGFKKGGKTIRVPLEITNRDIKKRDAFENLIHEKTAAITNEKNDVTDNPYRHIRLVL